MTSLAKQAIIDDLLTYINEELYEDGTTVDVDDDLLLDIGMDSLSLMLMVGFIESQFELSIEPAQITITHFRSVDIISDFLLSLKSS
ncbi:phosphopantetheine-binding protein [Aliiglaciecola sp.]|nr:phosphopantetheine-binding protein [Aliiglaciecola sp.]